MVRNCSETARLNAPAKLNLGLSIVGRRQEGYHELESLFWPIDFSDDIFVTPSAHPKLECSWAKEAPFTGSPIPTGEANLLQKVLREIPDAGTWDIALQKRIPMGAGLGGGSSNAGALLRFLARLKHLPEERCVEIAKKIGADVPFFLSPEPTWVTGIGEHRVKVKLTDHALQELAFLVVLLPVFCDTKEIFARYRASGHGFRPARGLVTTLDRVTFCQYLSNVGNDLEDAATQQHPLIGKVLSKLRQLPSLYAGMSGSGASCFAIFESEAALEENIKVILNFFRENQCRGMKARTFVSFDYGLLGEHHGNH